MDSRRAASLVFFIAVALLCGWVVATTYRFMAADWYSLEARWRISRAQEPVAKPIAVGDGVRLQARLQRAIDATPANPMLHDYMAALYVLRGQQLAKQDSILARTYLANAKLHLQTSVALRPTSGRSWASLAAAQRALGEPFNDVLVSAANAAFHSPVDPQVQKVVLPMVMGSWSVVPAELSDWVRRCYADGATRKRMRMDEMAKNAGLPLTALE